MIAVSTFKGFNRENSVSCYIQLKNIALKKKTEKTGNSKNISRAVEIISGTGILSSRFSQTGAFEGHLVRLAWEAGSLQEATIQAPFRTLGTKRQDTVKPLALAPMHTTSSELNDD